MSLSRRSFFRSTLGLVGGAVASSIPLLREVAAPLLLPYKGKQTLDAAAFYCPYIPLVHTVAHKAQGSTWDDIDVTQPVIEFETKYGIDKFS